MLFNSLDFAIFLPIVFLLYWFVANRDLKHQNFLLLVASYFFYACWDYRFLFLLMFSSFLDYFTGLKMHETQNQKIRKFWFWLSVGINLGFLGIFKYYNFFADSFADALSLVGFKADFWTLKVILPVGISFYTFHGLSYVIDINNKKIKAEKNFIEYAVFVSFFPLLVAGPIERATHLLPQIKKERVFNYLNATDGLRQILWGLFKKIVVADNCAEFANKIFNNSEVHSGGTLFLGALFFTVQIYCDFSGYSDIALGTARLFGIELLRNFAFPYFSRDIAEFWRRWHISLSTWFRDYLYIPLGGSKGGTWMKVRNTFIIFVVSGFWHGANWTFIAWGTLNAIYFLPLLLLNKNRDNLEIVAHGRYFPTLREFLSMAVTFFLTVIAWIFFRAQSMTQAIDILRTIGSDVINKTAYVQAYNYLYWKVGFIIPIIVLLFFIVEWLGRAEKYAMAKVGYSWPLPVRYAFYNVIVFAVLFYAGAEQEFIYFQF